MKKFVVVLMLAAASLAQPVRTRDVGVTAVAGESWLTHLHRTLAETSMGKTGRLGPAVPASRENISGWRRVISSAFTGQDVALRGSDLYRLNCRGCHGESGLGAPPEINSVINPTRATSVALTMERMNKLGMNISPVQAAELAHQSGTALLQRVHNGGSEMPPFPHLSEAEVRAIVAYLNQLAGVPGAEQKQAVVEESPLRIGEHIVKSTCHICHKAAGANPSPEQLWDGAIPPLSTLTTRTRLPEFIRKVRSGSPVTMAMPPMSWRGRMPVFYYLSEEEAAGVYLYLTVYPPYAGAVLDPGMPAPPLEKAAGEDTPFVVGSQPARAVAGGEVNDTKNVALPLVAELFATFLLAGGLVFTVREFRRFRKSEAGNMLEMNGSNVAPDATHDVTGEVRHQLLGEREPAASKEVAVMMSDGQPLSFSEADCRTFESAWLARRLEDEDWVA